MGLLAKLFNWPRVSEYERGKENAQRFLSTAPEEKELHIHYNHAACCRDEYDRGYLHALQDSRQALKEPTNTTKETK